MKSFLLCMICALLCLQSCKKEVQKNSELSISGFGAIAFASGDAISIFGSGFDPNPANDVVTFDGVNGEVATASANRLQVIAPVLTNSGKITVTVHGKSVTSSQNYTIVNVLQGTYANSFILTADKKYLLRGNVIFNSTLAIQAGTVIYGEKLTHGSLTANDVDFEGTAAKPIIFTSDQAPGSRYPGDWTGISIGGNTSPTSSNVIIPNGIVEYVRVEYAGYGKPGSAIAIGVVPNGIYQYIQASYSAGTGISLAGVGYYNIAGGYIHNIVAFGCLGDDFTVSAGIIAQFGLGLKDPYFAAVKGNGIGFTLSAAAGGSSGMALMSNFTLVGYNPDARNILNVGPTLTNDAGSGVFNGEPYTQSYGYPGFAGQSVALYNSVLAASWQSGVAIAGYNNWTNDYENAAYNNPIVFRNNFIAGTSPAVLPQRGGAFGYFNNDNNGSTDGGFVKITSDPNRALFAGYNDTTKNLSFSLGKDDLGIKALADYNNLHNPGVLPAAGSLLLNSAKFPSGSYIDNPYFNKDITYVGAFGTSDWTQPWCNFNPQSTQY